LAKLCKDWESAALMAEKAGTRVCLLRLGVILGREGGVLINLDRALLFSMSAYFGKGDQIIPWIHMIDVVRIIQICIESKIIRGPINCTAPMPVTSKEFAQQIRDITACKFLLRIPAFLIKILLGEASNLLMYSHNAIPKKLKKLGYEFKYGNLKDALYEEFSSEAISIKKYSDLNVLFEEDKNTESSGVIDTFGGTLQKDGYRIQKGQYTLNTKVTLNRDAKDVFSFFSSPLNLGFLTPSWMKFRILEVPDTIEAGSRIIYRINLGILGIKFRWTTKVVTWHPDQVFVDIQESGPYSLWFHQHTIRSTDSGLVEMGDLVIYRVPFGILGKVAHRLFIKKTLTRIFNYRRKVIQMRF
jgi:ligand-binding SRPBCC domain-containing protein